MPVVEFALPDVGEGLTEAEILSWLVSEGEVVRVNDLLVEVETAKAVVELPSPAAGTVLSIHVEAGTTVPVGTVIVTLGDPSDVLAEAAPSGGADAPPAAAAAEPAPAAVADEAKPLVLVGTGPSAPAARKRKLGVSGKESLSTEVPDRPRAKPPVRALARSLDIDLASLPADASGVVHREAVLAAAEREQVRPAPIASADEDLRIPVRGVRKATAEAVSRSAFTAPHVTEWLTVDVTPTMELVARLKADRAFQGVRINPLLLVARAFLLAIRRHPEINASWDEAAQEIVQYRHVNLGIAAATPRGLLVPNIKAADTLDFVGLAGELGELVENARSGRTSPAAMSGGTITITNIGALGVDAGTPILNPGEAAILAFGAIRKMPWVVGDEIVPRQVTQLALSFDHRLVDGELGSSVLAELGAILADPARALIL
ncbi:dihydrolipoamide acetyltransferase family protein [Microbacterium sp. RD1]|uniref:dihydrolipoamide acetyltransferase family protein n=1 Tax=Microbacterium sp. RD1 TaxID=3457313 RepID=UPI003FA5F604